MNQLLDNIKKLANRASLDETGAEDAKIFAEAGVQLIAIYQIWKDLEIHEKYHVQNSKLPGETPLGGIDIM